MGWRMEILLCFPGTSGHTTAVIQCHGLTKVFKTYHKAEGLRGSLRSLVARRYVDKVAVCEFSLTIEPGEIVALLGPNGSGKTTLMKMLTGIIVPSAGEMAVCGHVPFDREKQFRKKIALVMGQKSQLWWDIPAMDSFRLLSRYYEIDPNWFKRRMDELVEALQVQGILHVHVRKLSLGERMKLELIASLLHRPEVIFLDEPTIGLDLMAQENIRAFIKKYHQQHHCTIILTSHYMVDVEALCERLVFMFNGEKYFDGKLARFANILGQKKCVNFHFKHPQDKQLPFWQNYQPIWDEQGTQVKLHLEVAELSQVSCKVLADYPVSDFFTEKSAIEKVVRTLMENPQIIKEKGEA